MYYHFMRSAVVCQSPVPGGAERYLKQLYPRLQGLGHRSYLIGHVPGWADEVGLPVVPARFGPKWGGRRTLKLITRLPMEQSEVYRLIRRDGADADIFHVQFKREQIGLTRVLDSVGPVIWTEHGRFTPGIEGRLLATGYRAAAQRVGAIICVSELVATDVRRIVGDRVRIEVIPNAVDSSKILPPTEEERVRARRLFGIPEREVVMAWVGQIHPGKLPLMAARVGQAFGGITLMAGKGSGEASLREATDGTRVRFLGYQKDPASVYCAADVFLFTSKGSNEGYPTYSILEASAHGLPIVANIGSGIGNLLEGAGALIGGDDPAELAALAMTAASDRRRSDLARSWSVAHDIEKWALAHDRVMREVAAVRSNR